MYTYTNQHAHTNTHTHKYAQGETENGNDEGQGQRDNDDVIIVDEVYNMPGPADLLGNVLKKPFAPNKDWVRSSRSNRDADKIRAFLSEHALKALQNPSALGTQRKGTCLFLSSTFVGNCSSAVDAAACAINQKHWVLKDGTKILIGVDQRDLDILQDAHGWLTDNVGSTISHVCDVVRLLSIAMT